MPGELAWIVAIPGAVLLGLALLVAAPPLSHWLIAPTSTRLWFEELGRPEPTEHTRYFLAAVAPLALAGSLVILHRRTYRHRVLAVMAVRFGEALALAFVAFAFVAQHALSYGGVIARLPHRVYFTDPTLVVSGALAIAFAALLHGLAARVLAAALRETPWRRIAGAAVAALFVAAWLLTAVNTDGSVGRARGELLGNVPLWLDEAFAVLNGVAPLVSFHAQYSQIWPYAVAGIMSVFGATLAVYTVTAALATGAVMLAVYGILRRIVRSSLALMLFVPFLAMSFFREEGTLNNVYGPSNLLTLFPGRYGGPYLLAWLVARRLDGARPRHATLLLFIAGLVTINNLEFGAPGLVATLAALVWTDTRPFWPRVGRLLAAAAVGLLAAAAAVSLLTLAVAGSLPRFGLMLEFSRLYALSGFGMLPMPTFGIHFALYVTFAAAIMVATVRALSGQERLLTGMLCWTGVFGLGAGVYFAGRSHADVLIDIFSPWALALALLLVAAVRGVLARTSRLPTVSELAIFFGFGLAVCSIAQTPTPWSQISRLRHPTSRPLFALRAADRFIERSTKPDEAIGILGPLGHRIAYDIGVRDVLPYAHIESMPSLEQWDEALRALRERGVVKLFAYEPELNASELDYLQSAGWTPTTKSASSGYLLLLRSLALSDG